MESTTPSNDKLSQIREWNSNVEREEVFIWDLPVDVELQEEPQVTKEQGDQ